MLNRQSNRGISPLITTVLIIGMVVVASVIVMLWGQGFTEELIEKGGAVSLSQLSCVNDIKIDIIRHSGSLLTVENAGSGKIDAFTLVEDGGNPKKQYVEITPGNINEVSHNAAKEVKVIPEIKIAKGLYQPCSEQGLTYKVI